MAPSTALVLGATGFVGGHLCELLAEKYPDLQLLCLVRDTTPQKVDDLRKLNPSIEIVEGTLNDSAIISAAAEKVDIVIHIAHSDHAASVEAVLAGLTHRARTGGQQVPIYLHMSGLGVIADNVCGEKADHVKEWTDVGFRLEEYAPFQQRSVQATTRILPVIVMDIFEAGARDEERIQTAILFPGLIYGLGKTHRSGAWVPVYSSFAKAAGHAGTWGPGEVSQYCVHVRDVAAAVLYVLGYLLEDPRRGGNDGLFFVTSREPTMTWREINSVMGDVLHARGMVNVPGTQPFSPSITDPLGHYGWSLLGSNGHARADRLLSLGWKAAWSQKEPLRGIIKEMLEVGV